MKPIQASAYQNCDPLAQPMSRQTSAPRLPSTGPPMPTSAST